MDQSGSTKAQRDPQYGELGPLRDELLNHYNTNKNWQKKHFLNVKTVRKLLATEHAAESIAKALQLLATRADEGSTTTTTVRLPLGDEVQKVREECPVLYGTLVLAGLERHIGSLMYKGYKDEFLTNNYHELHLDLTEEEQTLLERYYRSISPVFPIDTDLDLSAETVLPYSEFDLIKDQSGATLHGSFGVICAVEVAEGHLQAHDMARRPQDTTRLVIKRIPMRGGDTSKQVARYEFETLRQRKHKNIVPLLASYWIDTIEYGEYVTSLDLIFPRADMNLEEWMSSRDPQAAPDRVAVHENVQQEVPPLNVMFQVASGLAAVHREQDGKITSHHDLKPKNILVFKRRFMIADLGCSRLRPTDDESGTTRLLGTYDYNPPEYENSSETAPRKHGRAFDIWSLGCIFIELITLAVYGRNRAKIREFRDKRQANTLKRARQPPQNRKESDASFHNNMNVVGDWVKQLKQDTHDPDMPSIIRLTESMLNERPADRPHAWEVALDLYILPKYKRMRSLIPPVDQYKYNNGQTQTPLDRAKAQHDKVKTGLLEDAGYALYPREAELATKENGGLELIAAARNNRDAEVKSLLKKRVNPMVHDKEGKSPLFWAACHGHYKVAEILLEHRPRDLVQQKERGGYGDTPLHVASSRGRTSLLELMLEYADDPENLRQNQGKTLLHLAAEWVHVETVIFLLERGMRVSSMTNDDDTVLHMPMTRHNPPELNAKVIEMLLDAHDGKECIEFKNERGETPLWLAYAGDKSRNNYESAEILERKGASIHVTNGKVDLLHLAVKKENLGFLETRLKYFTQDEKEARDDHGRTPKMLAEQRNLPLYIKELDRHHTRWPKDVTIVLETL